MRCLLTYRLGRVSPNTEDVDAGTLSAKRNLEKHVFCNSATEWSASGLAPCTAHSSCPAGEGVTAPGTASANTQCTPCLTGKYSDTASMDECRAHSGCPAGQGLTSPGTASADTQCAGCLTGKFSTKTDPSPCGTCASACDSATQDEATECTARSNRVCRAKAGCNGATEWSPSGFVPCAAHSTETGESSA